MAIKPPGDADQRPKTHYFKFEPDSEHFDTFDRAFFIFFEQVIERAAVTEGKDAFIDFEMLILLQDAFFAGVAAGGMSGKSHPNGADAAIESATSFSNRRSSYLADAQKEAKPIS